MNSKQQFKELQNYWYDKLKQTGFDDIEQEKNNVFYLKQSAAHNFYNLDPFSQKIREEYFRVISQFIQDEKTVFRNDLDRYILNRHSQGAKIKQICDELSLQGLTRDRKTVRIIIRRYEMAWGLRFYTRRELHLKG